MNKLFLVVNFKSLLFMKHFFIWIFLFFFSMSGFAQTLNIKGQITDTSGESIIGVNVKVRVRMPVL